MTEDRQLKILALVPARSGSKSIPDKNIRIAAGKPLLAHSISHALTSKLINRTIVSTDSPVYAEIAREYGAEVPFLRPSEISQDLSTDLDVFLHALKWLAENEDYIPDICVHLRPTYPIRKIEDIDRAIQILTDDPGIDSVRSVALSKETPLKMWFMRDDGLLSPVVRTELREAYNLPRQLLPAAYLQNACIDAVRTNVITGMKSMTGARILGYLMDEKFDIDTEEQLRDAEKYLTQVPVCKAERPDYDIRLDGARTFCFDIDGVIAAIVTDNQYYLAQPQRNNINMINYLYEQGHQIILFTGRGSATGIDWTDVTKKQMREWGVKYHKLLFGKPAADYYVDDKMVPVEKIKHILKQITERVM